MVNTNAKGRRMEKETLELMNEWLASCAEKEYIEYVDGGLAPKTARRFGKGVFASQNNDLLRAWDGWMLYRIYEAPKPTLYLFQTRSWYRNADHRYLKSRTPQGACCYYVVYNKPPKRLDDKETIITLPIGCSKPRLWCIAL